MSARPESTLGRSRALRGPESTRRGAQLKVVRPSDRARLPKARKRRARLAALSLVAFVGTGLFGLVALLRIRSGQYGGRGVALTGIILGCLALALVWFFLTYLIRIFINLFVEPTVNPIKHFPVVTVAAKLILPIIPLLGRFISGQLQPFTPSA